MREMKPLGLGDRLGMLAEEPRHLAGRLDVALGVLFEPAAGGRDGQVLADAGDDVLQRAAAGLVVEHVVDGEHRDADAAGEIGEAVEAGAVVAVVGAGGGEPDAAGRARGESAEGFLAAVEVGLVDVDDEQLAVGEALVARAPAPSRRRRCGRTRSPRAAGHGRAGHRSRGCSRPSRREGCRWSAACRAGRRRRGRWDRRGCPGVPSVKQRRVPTT